MTHQCISLKDITIQLLCDGYLPKYIWNGTVRTLSLPFWNDNNITFWFYVQIKENTSNIFLIAYLAHREVRTALLRLYCGCFFTSWPRRTTNTTVHDHLGLSSTVAEVSASVSDRTTAFPSVSEDPRANSPLQLLEEQTQRYDNGKLGCPKYQVTWMNSILGTLT